MANGKATKRHVTANGGNRPEAVMGHGLVESLFPDQKTGVRAEIWIRRTTAFHATKPAILSIVQYMAITPME